MWVYCILCGPFIPCMWLTQKVAIHFLFPSWVKLIISFVTFWPVVTTRKASPSSASFHCKTSQTTTTTLCTTFFTTSFGTGGSFRPPTSPPVWPDDGIKICPIFQILLKNSQIIFTWKYYYLIKPKNLPEYLGYFCKTICYQDVKNRPIRSHCPLTHFASYFFSQTLLISSPLSLCLIVHLFILVLSHFPHSHNRR